MGTRPRWFAALSPRRRRFVTACAGIAVAGIAAAVIPTLASGGGEVNRTGYPAQDKLGPVLLVPGYGGNTNTLAILAAKIRATGRQATVVSLPQGGIGDLAVQADILDGYVNSALHGAPSVDLVGYSAGGVVVRLWVADHGGASKARRVITLGSPFHGTTVASAGAAVDPNDCPVACQELIPGSSLLSRVGDAPPNSHPQWLSIWTTQDQTVVPPDSASLPGAIDLPVQSVCANEQVAHGDLPKDAAVVGIVLSELGTAPLQAPQASACDSLKALSR